MSVTQPSTLLESTMSVTQVSHLINSTLRELGDGWIEGEIRSITQHRSGHVYLTLADEDSNLDACIWKGRVRRCLPLPKNGDLVQAHYERIDFYAPRGAVKLVVDELKPTGEGELLRRRAETLSRLRADGLCDEDRRKTLPAFPRRVGVIAAQGSDAKVDVLRALRERMPAQDIVFAAAAVQGVEAVGSLIDALGALQAIDDVDVIIVARGGGSVADLIAFDDERLCRAIFACAVPVITSIGHTKDRPNCDYVASAFAPVPAKAAEYAVAHSASELFEDLDRHAQRLGIVTETIERHGERLMECTARLAPRQRLSAVADGLESCVELSRSRAQTSYHRRAASIAQIATKLDMTGDRLPRRTLTDQLREQLQAASNEQIAKHRQDVEDGNEALQEAVRRLPGSAEMDVFHAHLHGATVRMRERRRDYSRAFDRLEGDSLREVRRRCQGELRSLARDAEPLAAVVSRALARRSERAADLCALAAAKDFRRHGWVMAENEEGRGVGDVAQLSEGSSLRLHFIDGSASVNVQRIRFEKQEGEGQ